MKSSDLDRFDEIFQAVGLCFVCTTKLSRMQLGTACDECYNCARAAHLVPLEPIPMKDLF